MDKKRFPWEGWNFKATLLTNTMLISSMALVEFLVDVFVRQRAVSAKLLLLFAAADVVLILLFTLVDWGTHKWIRSGSWSKNAEWIGGEPERLRDLTNLFPQFGRSFWTIVGFNVAMVGVLVLECVFGEGYRVDAGVLWRLALLTVALIVVFSVAEYRWGQWWLKRHGDGQRPAAGDAAAIADGLGE